MPPLQQTGVYVCGAFVRRSFCPRSFCPAEFLSAELLSEYRDTQWVVGKWFHLDSPLIQGNLYGLIGGHGALNPLHKAVINAFLYNVECSLWLLNATTKAYGVRKPDVCVASISNC